MRKLFLVILLTACNSPTYTADARIQFLGSWSNTSGTVNATCTGMAASAGTLAAGDLKITISDGAGGNQLILAFADPPNCQVDALVSGSTATVSADKACTISGGTLTVKAGGVFTTGDGITMNATFTSVAEGGGNTCTQANTAVFGH